MGTFLPCNSPNGATVKQVITGEDISLWVPSLDSNSKQDVKEENVDRESK